MGRSSRSVLVRGAPGGRSSEGRAREDARDGARLRCRRERAGAGREGALRRTEREKLAIFRRRLAMCVCVQCGGRRVLFGCALLLAFSKSCWPELGHTRAACGRHASFAVNAYARAVVNNAALSFQPIALARASERPSCATSSECVKRVRNKSPSWLRKTWVL